MPAGALDELREFHRFIADKISSGGVELSPEEALDEWRRLHPERQSAKEDLRAIREALDDVAKGDRGVPFADFDRNFRARHNFSDQS